KRDRHFGGVFFGKGPFGDNDQSHRDKCDETSKNWNSSGYQGVFASLQCLCIRDQRRSFSCLRSYASRIDLIARRFQRFFSASTNLYASDLASPNSFAAVFRAVL